MLGADEGAELSPFEQQTRALEDLFRASAFAMVSE